MSQSSGVISVLDTLIDPVNIAFMWSAARRYSCLLSQSASWAHQRVARDPNQTLLIQMEL